MRAESFGNRIKELRESRGITQAQLADRLNVTRSTVANWEAGNRLPDLSMLALLADELDVDTAVFLDELRSEKKQPVIMVVDDMQLLLNGFTRLLRRELPEAEITGFSNVTDAVQFARGKKVAIAFLDIELQCGDGISLARELVRINPRINIIFLTSHPEYMESALSDHCSGYILKPLTPEKIRHEISHLRFPIRGLNE
jgi:transcriptional regulator with XRE-family HTH domain